MRRNRGVITIFVALMLLSILSLGTLVLEAGRFQAAKTQLQEANISASTSMIAAFDQTLYEKYGLLAIDTARFTPERYMDYLYYNSDLSADLPGNRVTRLYSIDSVEVLGMYNLTAPSILKKQMLTRAKYHVIPEDYALNIYTMNSFFAELQNKCSYIARVLQPAATGAAGDTAGTVSPDLQLALSNLYETYCDLERYDTSCTTSISPASMAILPSHAGTVSPTAPDEDLAAIDATIDDVNVVLGAEGSSLQLTTNPQPDVDVSVDVGFIANMTEGLKDVESLGVGVLSAASIYSQNCRALAQNINAAIEGLSGDREGNLLLNSYMAAYLSNRTRTTEFYSGPARDSNIQGGTNANFVSACAEYIFGGSNSEAENQERAYDYIYAIRFINNLYMTLSGSRDFQDHNSLSVAVHLAWAHYETLTDMQIMTEMKASVPMTKSRMILSMDSPAAVAAAFHEKDVEKAMTLLGYYRDGQCTIPGFDYFSYSDCVAVALWFVPNTVKMMRTADLIQLEMRYHQQYVEHEAATFLMNEQNAYCRVKCKATLNPILPVVSMGTNSGVKGISFTSIKYAGY